MPKLDILFIRPFPYHFPPYPPPLPPAPPDACSADHESQHLLQTTLTYKRLLTTFGVLEGLASATTEEPESAEEGVTEVRVRGMLGVGDVEWGMVGEFCSC